MPKHEYTVKAEANGSHSIACGCGNKYGLFETYFKHLEEMGVGADA